MPQKTAPSLKIIFQVLHKTWYLSYFFCLIFLLNLKLHPTMTIITVSKDLNFQVLEMSPEKNIKYFERFKPI